MPQLRVGALAQAAGGSLGLDTRGPGAAAGVTADSDIVTAVGLRYGNRRLGYRDRRLACAIIF